MLKRIFCQYSPLKRDLSTIEVYDGSAIRALSRWRSSLRSSSRRCETSRAVDAPSKRAGPQSRPPPLHAKPDEPLEQVVRRNWPRIAALYFPEAVIVDRSAFEAKPAEDGSLFLDSGPTTRATTPLRLPGLTLLPGAGRGRLPATCPSWTGSISRAARKFLDNMRVSRAVGPASRAPSPRAEIEDELVRLADRARNRGAERATRQGSRIAEAARRNARRWQPSTT